MEAYSAILKCKEATYHGQLDEENLCITINCVKIEVEFDGNLYIENPYNYTEKQLAFLSYHKMEHSNFLLLTEYIFQYALPVKLLDKERGQILETVLTGAIENRDSTAYSWSVMDACSSASDIEYAMQELQAKLSPKYIWMACCCCKYGQSHPYGGDPYINFLCFRRSKGEYERLGTIDKKDWVFFSNAQRVEATRPFYCCETFSYRNCLD